MFPFYRFEFVDEATTEVSISIKSKQGGATYNVGLQKPKKDFPAFQPASDVFINPNSNGIAYYLNNNCLSLDFEIKFQIKLASGDLCDNLLKHKSKIIKDLDAFIGDKNTSDFLYRVGNKEFYVHKMMLSGKLFGIE